MEWAQAFVVRPALLQRDKLRHHVDDICGVHDAVYGGAVDHQEMILAAKLRNNYLNTKFSLNKLAQAKLFNNYEQYADLLSAFRRYTSSYTPINLDLRAQVFSSQMGMLNVGNAIHLKAVYLRNPS